MKSCAKVLWEHIAAAQWVQKDISVMQSEEKSRHAFICIVAFIVELKLPDSVCKLLGYKVII